MWTLKIVKKFSLKYPRSPARGQRQVPSQGPPGHRSELRRCWPKTFGKWTGQSIRGGQRSAGKRGSARAPGKLGKRRGGEPEGACPAEHRSRRSVCRGGRRERACHALPMRWPALGREWPPTAGGGGWPPQPVSTPTHHLSRTVLHSTPRDVSAATRPRRHDQLFRPRVLATPQFQC